jgi:hypothetical protein
MVEPIPDDPADDSPVEPGPPIWVAIWIVAGLALWVLIALAVRALIG